MNTHLKNFADEARNLHEIADTYVAKKQAEEEFKAKTASDEEALGKSVDAQKAEAKNA